MAVSPPRSDPWSRWFFRAVQMVGLALGVHEALGAGRPYVLLFCGALILGAAGLRFILLGVGEVSKRAAEAERDAS